MKLTMKKGGAIGPFQTFQEVPDALLLRTGEFYNMDLDYETHVSPDKAPFKIVPCTICRRAIVVNTFYVLAWAKCHGSGCSGEGKEKASVAVAQAGRTDPATAVNLVECLLNAHFAIAMCPAHPDDEEHVMELKSVSHSPHYGPTKIIGYEKGRPVYKQIEKGETVMHQCTVCRAVVTYSTTAQYQFKRVNEPDEDSGKHVNGWASDLGFREAEVNWGEDEALAEHALSREEHDGAI